MILEGVVTTLGPDGVLNVAPMGPRLDPGFDRFTLRPFRESQTYRNLLDRGEGVLHVTDDVLLIARAAIGTVSDAPSRPAERVAGRVLTEACRFYEFTIVAVDDRGERASFTAKPVHHGTQREFFGFNRAKHAVIETAILATRITFLPLDGLAATLDQFREITHKTGGPEEIEALTLLLDYMRPIVFQRGLVLGGSER